MIRFALAIFAALLYVSNFEVEAAKGYYFRPLFGKLPLDAFPTGVSSTGEKTYVGQVAHLEGKGALLPAAYVPSLKKAFYEFDKKQFDTDKLIQILCTEEKEKFKWIPVSAGDPVERSDNWVYVLGGQEFKLPIAVGRINTGTNLAQGGILIEDNKFTQLHYNKGQEGHVASKFDALYYDKN